MPRRPTLFKQRDVARATRAILGTGLEIARVEIAKDGSIVVVPGKSVQATHDNRDELNEWDTVS
jgi:hypothetical protein